MQSLSAHAELMPSGGGIRCCGEGALRALSCPLDKGVYYRVLGEMSGCERTAASARLMSMMGDMAPSRARV